MAETQRWSPPKLTLTNITSGSTLEVMFNPSELEEQLTANWSELTVPGLSHQVLQYSHTTNEQFTLELFWRATTRAEFETIAMARRWLKSVLYPRQGAEDVAGGAPPRVLVVWPGMLSMQCVVRSLRFRHQMFNKYARSRVYTATAQCSEIRDVRLTMEDVLDDVSLRFGEFPRQQVGPERRQGEG